MMGRLFKKLRGLLQESLEAPKRPTIATSPLGRVRPSVEVLEGEVELCLECVPCREPMEWVSHEAGWECSGCGFTADYAQTHAMFCDVCDRMDHMIRFLEQTMLRDQ